MGMTGASVETLIRRMWYGGRKGRSAERRLRRRVHYVSGSWWCILGTGYFTPKYYEHKPGHGFLARPV
jgi:hypothetical protein